MPHGRGFYTLELMLRPLEHLNNLSRRYPEAWKQVDIFRQGKGNDLPDWPDWCFMPMAAWYSVVANNAGIDRLPLHLIGDVAHLAAIGTWRYSQGVYRFDPETANALSDTVLHGEMPVDVIFRLPEWSLYIEMPEDYQWDKKRLFGFWAHLEYDINTHQRELRLLLDTESGLVTQILHIGLWTVTEAIDRWFSESERQSIAASMPMPDRTIVNNLVEKFSVAINPLISMLLYLCSDEPEISNRDYPDHKPTYARPSKTKKGWRLFAPPKPIIWSVGEQIGDKLRQANVSAPTGQTVRTHLRRAHWHGFWTGPRTGKRQFRYKWLPPIIVGHIDDPKT